MPGDQIRLLALDGGGVRGLSSLMILRRLMETVDADSPPLPCDYFDMIGGTSTGGLIAIMLGRLRMSVDECIEAYTALSDRVFTKTSHRLKINGQIQGRFDAEKLAQTIKELLRKRGLDDDVLLKDIAAPCKVFVCATSKETSRTVCLASYRSPRSDNSDLLNSTKVWQACRATSAATSFFDPISIGPFDEEFVDGAMGANNPVYDLWNQAQDIWGAEHLLQKLQCIVSIGTGVPSLQPVRDDALGIMSTLKELATETEKTAQQFHRDKASLYNEKRYFRFNVDQGLQDVGLEESKKKKVIAAATRNYVASQTVFGQMQDCARSLIGRQYNGPYRTVFTLEGVPASNNFVDRAGDTAEIEDYLLPQRLNRSQESQRRKTFVIHGLGGIGKTQLAADFARRHKNTFSSIFWLDSRSEDRLRQSLATCARRIPQGQIPESSRTSNLDSAGALDAVVADVLEWLARPDNTEWLLVVDNVDLDKEQGGKTSTFDVQKYIPGDHGSILITTRLLKVAQLGESKKLEKADEALSKAVYEKWYGGELVLDAAGKKLLDHLDGLPLALAQAAAYCRETGLDVAAYVELYDKHWNDLMTSDTDSGSPLVDYAHRSVATTWAISLKAIENKNEGAANLLRLWAMMSNKDLWYELFLDASTSRETLPEWLLGMISGQEVLPEWLLKIAGNKATFSNTMRLLRQYSMVEASSPDSEQDKGQGVYSLHPVVHKWASHLQDAARKQEYLRLAIIVVGLSSPTIADIRRWALYRRLLPHAEMCYRWAKNGQVLKSRGLDDMLFIESIYYVALVLDSTDRMPEAEAMYKWALQEKEIFLGLDHISTLTAAQNLGGLYSDLGPLSEAESLCQRALQGFEKTKGPTDISVLRITRNLGNIYLRQTRLSEAEGMFLRVLQGEHELGPEHPLMINSLSDLGNTYRLQGRLPEAEETCLQALQAAGKGLGPDHESTLTIIANLGAIYSDHDRLPEAEAMFFRALKGTESYLGLDSIKVYNTVTWLGDVYIKDNRLRDAETMLLRALAGYNKIFGFEHGSTLYVADTLGVVYYRQGRLLEAKTLFQQALEGLGNLYGPDHENTLAAVSKLSECRKRLRLSGTETVPQTVLEEVDNALGSNRASALSFEVGPAANSRASRGRVLLPETQFGRNKSLLPEKAEK